MLTVSINISSPKYTEEGKKRERERKKEGVKEEIEQKVRQKHTQTSNGPLFKIFTFRKIFKNDSYKLVIYEI